MFTLYDAQRVIADKPEFSLVDKVDYWCIDYNVQTPTTFVGATPDDSVILINLRGTCFDRDTGKIIRLPLHKFHNMNECAGYMESDLDFSKMHYIMEKLDGSMIAPIPIGNSYRLGTRAGITDVSNMAEEWLAEQCEITRSRYDTFIQRMIDNGFTPIFEFCSRRNKVVIDHPEAHLTLLAVRHNATGVYNTKEQLEYLSEFYEIPLVKMHSKDLIDINKVREWKDSEGIVIAFEHIGKRVKIKAEEYVRKHRAKDLVRFEKDVVKLILEDNLDDVLPLLDDDQRDKVVAYSADLQNSIQMAISRLEDGFDYVFDRYPERKDFAKFVTSFEMKPFASFFFKMFDNKGPQLKEYILSNCSSSTKIEAALKLLVLPRWNND